MKILKINPNNPEEEIIAEAIKVLNNGGVVVYPTDTCYGLGADLTHVIGVSKLFKIKSRDNNKGIAVIVDSIDKIKKMAEIDEKREKFLRKYLPGPITAVLLNTDYRYYNHLSIGVRIPNNKVTRLIADKLGHAFTTTSANVSGSNVCYSVDDLVGQFKDKKYKPDLIIDAGKLAINPPSTVVDLIKWPPRVLRQGGLKIDL